MKKFLSIVFSLIFLVTSPITTQVYAIFQCAKNAFGAIAVGGADVVLQLFLYEGIIYEN
jgi:hypothetical protein